MREYAVYKGDNLIAMGTAQECAEKMGVSPEYIYWLTMPTAKRRLAARKNPEKCTTAIVLDDDEQLVDESTAYGIDCRDGRCEM